MIIRCKRKKFSLFNKNSEDSKLDFGNGFTEKDIKKSSNITTYLPTLLAPFTGHVGVTSGLGIYSGNKKLKKELRKGEDFEDARKKAVIKAAITGGTGGLAISKLLYENSMKDAALYGGISGAGLSALGTLIKANSIKRQKEKKNKKKC